MKHARGSFNRFSKKFNLAWGAAAGKIGLIVASFILILMINTAQAAKAGADPLLVQAIKAMNQDRWSAARQLIIQSGDPLGRKIYLWMFLQRDKGDVDYAALTQFMNNNPDWPGLKPFREQAENAMPNNLSAKGVKEWFDEYPPLTAKGLDRYLSALILSGQKAQAKEILSDWWASRLSTKDEQKAIYYKYGGMIDLAAHRRRLDTLLFSGQYTNARGVAEALGRGFPELTEARIALAEEKPDASSLVSKVPNHLQNDPGLMFERLRFRRKKNMDVEALEVLHRHPPVDEIQNPAAWWGEENILIRRMMEAHRYQSAYLLASEHFQSEGQPYADAQWTAGWLALRFMKKAPEAYERFQTLYDKMQTPISKARAAYWAGRAADVMKNPEDAKVWYDKAATYQTTFYGQLAGAKLGMAQALPHARAPELTAEDLAAYNKSDLIRAAVLLYDADLRPMAYAFLVAFIDQQKSPKAYRYAAELAGDIGDSRDALKIAKDATKEGMFLTAQSFPVITDSLRKVDVEWALVHALIRQESMFDTAAVSPVGALGLMQLMPSTAKSVAKKHGMRVDSAALINDPAYNIRLGCVFMDELLDRYNGYYPLAVAAYNAGPSNVDQWLQTYGDPRAGQIDLIDWIELIPMYETRNYVQRVLESVYIYRLRLKGIQRATNNPIHIAMAR